MHFAQKFSMVLISFLFSTAVFAYGSGISTHPLTPKVGIISTEFAGIVSGGKGAGLQVRYTRKLNQSLTLDGGVGFTDGDHANRIFASVDLEVYPDYGQQPRLSVKATMENAKEFGTRRNIIGISPLLSKGIEFWKYPAHPFIGLPVGLTLNSDTKSYEIRSSAAVGFTSKVPIEGYENLLMQVEADVNFNKSFTAFFFGLSYPLN